MRRTVLALLLAGLLLPGAAAASGTRLPEVPVPATDLADATGAVAPSAAEGHVVFSRLVPATGRYELVDVDVEHDAAVRVLPVGTRAVPFDADVGPLASGGAGVVFSGCDTDGTLGYVLPTVDFSAASGCRPYLLDLERTDARPRALRLAHRHGLSLTTPSLRGRSIAAVAAPASGRSQNARVLLWRTTGRAPIRLRGGSPPRCPYKTCKVAPRTSVDALDLGPRSVAFLWRSTEPDDGIGAGFELRSSSLRAGGSGRRVFSAGGYISGACGFRQPLSPSAGGGGGVAFLLAQSPCDVLQTSLQLQRAGAPEVVGARPAEGLAYGAAFTAGKVYWLRGSVPPSPDPAAAPPKPSPVPCTDAQCRLVVSDALPLSPASRR